MAVPKTLRHNLPLFFEKQLWNCDSCIENGQSFKSESFDSIVFHFKRAHLSAWIKKAVTVDHNVKKLQEKYQGVVVE